MVILSSHYLFILSVPLAGHSLSKYFLVLDLSLNIPAVFLLLSSFSLSSLDMRQTVMAFFYRQSTEGWCMSPIYPSRGTWAAESLLGLAWCRMALRPKRERVRETMRGRSNEDREIIWGEKRCKNMKGRNRIKGRRKQKEKDYVHRLTLTSSHEHKGRYTKEHIETISSHLSVTEICPAEPTAHWVYTAHCFTHFVFLQLYHQPLSPKTRCALQQAWKWP